MSDIYSRWRHKKMVSIVHTWQKDKRTNKLALGKLLAKAHSRTLTRWRSNIDCLFSTSNSLRNRFRFKSLLKTSKSSLQLDCWKIWTKFLSTFSECMVTAYSVQFTFMLRLEIWDELSEVSRLFHISRNQNTAKVSNRFRRHRYASLD